MSGFQCDATLSGINRMSQPKNMGHSVFQRLLDYAKNRDEDFNLLLVRYGVERLLYRLSISEHSERFVLKGASMFLIWKGQNYRVTRDADLLGFGSAEAEQIKVLFRDVSQLGLVDLDGIEFRPEMVEANPIREEMDYDGIRVTMIGLLHNARIPVQIDIGFGDVVTPEPEMVEFPTLLDAPAPKLKAYPRYTMVAEKFEAMVKLGMANSRMKDFYDVWLLSRLFEFNGSVLCEAVSNTFKRRSTSYPDGLPVAFTEEFSNDNQKQIQWKAFVKKSRAESVGRELRTVIDDIVVFLHPIIKALQDKTVLRKKWDLCGKWIDQM